MNTFTKYRKVFDIGFQNTFVYRANFLIRCAFGLLPLMGTLFLWRATFAGTATGQVAGYSLSGMVTYYLLVLLGDMLSMPTEDDWQIAADIKDGQISMFLIKPMDYLTYRLCLFWAYRLIYAAVTVIPVAIVILLMREFWVFPAEFWRLPAWFAAVLLSGLLQFLLTYCVAMSAFWLLEISTLVFIVFAVEFLLSGHVFPLDLLPAWASAILTKLPFAYEVYFPISIYLGKLNATEVAQGFLFQIGWIVIFYGLARWAFARGIKHYTAVGG